MELMSYANGRSLSVLLNIDNTITITEEDGCGEQQINLSPSELRRIHSFNQNPLPRVSDFFGRLLQRIWYRGYEMSLSSLEASAPDGLRPVVITKTKERRVIAVPRANSRVLIFEETLKETVLDYEYLGDATGMCFHNQRVNLSPGEFLQILAKME